MGYIYLIYLREFINAREPTYKIGKSNQPNYSRIKSYPKGSIVKFCKDVPECNNLEKILIQIFKDKFIQNRQYGLEYFTGDLNKMLEILNEKCNISINDKINISNNLNECDKQTFDIILEQYKKCDKPGFSIEKYYNLLYDEINDIKTINDLYIFYHIKKIVVLDIINFHCIVIIDDNKWISFINVNDFFNWYNTGNVDYYDCNHNNKYNINGLLLSILYKNCYSKYIDIKTDFELLFSKCNNLVKKKINDEFNMIDRLIKEKYNNVDQYYIIKLNELTTNGISRITDFYKIENIGEIIITNKNKTSGIISLSYSNVWIGFNNLNILSTCIYNFYINSILENALLKTCYKKININLKLHEYVVKIESDYFILNLQTNSYKNIEKYDYIDINDHNNQFINTMFNFVPSNSANIDLMNNIMNNYVTDKYIKSFKLFFKSFFVTKEKCIFYDSTSDVSLSSWIINIIRYGLNNSDSILYINNTSDIGTAKLKCYNDIRLLVINIACLKMNKQKIDELINDLNITFKHIIIKGHLTPNPYNIIKLFNFINKNQNLFPNENKIHENTIIYLEDIIGIHRGYSNKNIPILFWDMFWWALE